MTDFKHGEIVRFKGDDVDYRIDYENSDDTVDLVDLDRENNTIEFVPTRLLERAPTPLEPGDVIQDGEGDIFVVAERGKAVEEIYAFLNGGDYNWSPLLDELPKPLTKIGRVEIDLEKLKKKD